MDTDFGTKDCLVLILAMVANPEDWYEVDVFQAKSSVESCKNSDCKQTANKCKQTADKYKLTADKCKQTVDKCKQTADECKQTADKCKQTSWYSRFQNLTNDRKWLGHSIAKVRVRIWEW